MISILLTPLLLVQLMDYVENVPLSRVPLPPTELSLAPRPKLVLILILLLLKLQRLALLEKDPPMTLLVTPQLVLLVTLPLNSVQIARPLLGVPLANLDTFLPLQPVFVQLLLEQPMALA
jgi:hypothetical protein